MWLPTRSVVANVRCSGRQTSLSKCYRFVAINSIAEFDRTFTVMQAIKAIVPIHRYPLHRKSGSISNRKSALSPRYEAQVAASPSTNSSVRYTIYRISSAPAHNCTKHEGIPDTRHHCYPGHYRSRSNESATVDNRLIRHVVRRESKALARP